MRMVHHRKLTYWLLLRIPLESKCAPIRFLAFSNLFQCLATLRKSVVFIVRFEVFTAVTMKNAVFWDVTPCRSCVNRRFGGTYRLHLQGRKIRERGTSVIRWLRTAIPSSETAVHTRSTRRHIPEDDILPCSAYCLRNICGTVE
jgi:hypothetical protein